MRGAVSTAFCSIWHFINMLCEQVLAAEDLKCQFPGNCRALGSIQTNSGPESKPVRLRKMQQANRSVGYGRKNLVPYFCLSSLVSVSSLISSH